MSPTLGTTLERQLFNFVSFHFDVVLAAVVPALATAVFQSVALSLACDDNAVSYDAIPSNGCCVDSRVHWLSRIWLASKSLHRPIISRELSPDTHRMDAR